MSDLAREARRRGASSSRAAGAATSPRANARALAPVSSPPTRIIAPRTWTKSGKFQLVRRIAASTAHAPGFQIMSMRIRSTSDGWRAVCSTRPRCVRLSASSSALGPVWPAASSSLRLVHARPCTPRRCAARAPPRRPEHERRDDPAVPDVVAADENASQMPKTIVPPAPIPIARSRPSRPAPCGSSRPACPSRRTATIEHPEERPSRRRTRTRSARAARGASRRSSRRGRSYGQ